MSRVTETLPSSAPAQIARERLLELSHSSEVVSIAPVEPPQPISGKQPFWVEAIDDITVLERYRAAWQDLAHHTTEPNPFYEPWMLLPAWQAFGHEEPGTEFALVWQRDPRPKQPATLVGFVPLISRRRFGLLPLKLRRVWQHAFCYLCAPLVRRGVEQDVLESLLDWMQEQGQGLLKLRHLSAEGRLAQALIDTSHERGSAAFVVERYNRAMLRPAESYDNYIANSMTQHARHELRRQQKRLSAMGHLETRVLCGDATVSTSSHHDVNNWIDQFLTVEAAGWKGRECSALGSNPVSRAYFETICREAHARGRLFMLGLYLDGRPLAMKCNFLAGDGAFAFKIAFDEAYAKYSPGVLLEAENIRVVHDLQQIKWMDSCALPGHPMINRMWSERRTIQKVLVSPGGGFNNAAVDLTAALFAARRVFKGHAKAGSGANAPRTDK